MNTIDDRRALAALTKEFGSAAAAAAALDDLRAGMPKSVDEWRAATRVAHDGGRGMRKWLFILPDNHSIVGIYPLAIAAASRLDVTVRVPARFADPESFLMIFIEDLRRAGATIAVVPSTFRVLDDRHGFDAILAYGDDTTIAALAAVAGCPVQGFGGKFGVGIVDAARLAADAPSLARDFLSLGQTGCMATRVALIVGDADPQAAAETMARAARDFWRAELPWRERVGLDVEAFRLSRLGFAVHAGDARTPLVATRRVMTEQLNAELVTSAVATRPFTLPLMIVNESDVEFFVKTVAAPLLAAIPGATATTPLTKSHYRTLSFQVLGRANAPTWDGHHEMRALFRPH